MAKKKNQDQKNINDPESIPEGLRAVVDRTVLPPQLKDVQSPEVKTTSKVNAEEQIAGLDFAFRHGQLTPRQLVQGIEARGAAAGTVLDMLGILVARHNSSVQERLDLEMRPTPPSNPKPQVPSEDAEPPRMGGQMPDLNAIRDQMSRAVPRGGDGNIVTTTTSVPSGFALRGMKLAALEGVARLMTNL